jgi:cell division protein FtsB
MMRSPYKSPKDAPKKRFLRLPPTEKKRRKRRLLAWGAALLLGFLIYSFVGGESGLVRVRALKNETAQLEKRKILLAVEADRVERNRTGVAKDPLLEERVARERFHMVKKDEILYRYQAEEDSSR